MLIKNTALLALLALPICATIIPQPTITTNCTLNGAPVACGSNDGLAQSSASTFSNINGFGADTLQLIVRAVAVSGSWYGEPSTSFASIELSFLGSTDGPQREGLASFSMMDSADFGVHAGGVSFTKVDGLGLCSSMFGCHGTLVPFTLGTTFGVDLFAKAYNSQTWQVDGGDGTAMLTLQLFEANGSPVAIFDPPAVASVPEPGAWILVLIGLAVFQAATLIKVGRTTIGHIWESLKTERRSRNS